MSKWSHVIRSLIIQYAGRIIGLAASLLTTVLLTRALGVYGYGQYTTVFAIANLIIAFSDLGFFWSTIQHVKEGDPRQVSSEISGVRLVITLIVTVVSTVFIWLTGYPLIIKECFSVLSLFIISSALDNVMIAVHQSTYSMGWPTFSNLFTRILTLLLVAYGFYHHWDLFWLVTANGTTTVINFLMDWWVLVRRYGMILPKWLGFNWSKYYRSVLMLGAVSIVSALYLQVDTIILSALRSPVDVGIYGAAQKIASIVVIFQGMFLANFFPFLIEQNKAGKEAFEKAISNALLILMAIGVPLTFVLMAEPTGLVRVVAGQQFISTHTITFDSVPISTSLTLAILGVYILINYFDGIFTNALIALDRLKWLLGLDLIALVFNIATNIALDRSYSYLACAVLTVATEVIIAVGAFVKIRSLSRLSLPIKELAQIILAGIIAVAIMLISPDKEIFIELLIFGTVYLGALYLLMPAQRHQLNLFLKKGMANES